MIKLVNPFKRPKGDSKVKEDTDAEKLRKSIDTFKQSIDDIGSIDHPVGDDIIAAATFLVPLLDGWYSQIDDDLKDVIRFISENSKHSFMRVDGILKNNILVLYSDYIKFKQSGTSTQDSHTTTETAYETLEKYGVDYNTIVFGKPTTDIYSSNIGCTALIIPSTPISELDGYSILAQVNVSDLRINNELPEKGMFQFWVTPDLQKSKVIFLNSVAMSQCPVEGYVHESVDIAPEMGNNITFNRSVSVSNRTYGDIGLRIINDAINNSDMCENITNNPLAMINMLDIRVSFERTVIFNNTKSCVLGHPWDIKRQYKKSATTTLLYINTADFYPDDEINTILTWEVCTSNLYNLDTGIIDGVKFTVKDY